MLYIVLFLILRMLANSGLSPLEQALLPPRGFIRVWWTRGDLIWWNLVTSFTCAPCLGVKNAELCTNFFKKIKRKKDKVWEKKRWENSNLIVGRLHMVRCLLGSPWLAASRLRPFSFSNQWQTSLSSLHPTSQYPPPSPCQTPQKHPESG